jgi:competence protein ComFC
MKTISQDPEITENMEEIYSIFPYTDQWQTLIHEIKFKHRKRILKEMLSQIKILLSFSPDIITYIPLSKRGYLERGFNQSRIIARHLSKMMRKPLLRTLKKKHTQKQSHKNAEERRKIIRQSPFRLLGKQNLSGKTILLVDDIFTTGSTLASAAIKLKQAGAGNIVAFTLLYA